MRRVRVNQGVCSIPNTLSKSIKIPKYMLKIAQKYHEFLETVYTEYPKLVIFNINIQYTRFNPPPLGTVYPPNPLLAPTRTFCTFHYLTTIIFTMGVLYIHFKHLHKIFN